MIKRLYFSTNGRCSRKFYWLFGVAPFVVLGVLAGVVALLLQIPPNWLNWLILCVVAITTWPILAMQIKRWHDIGLTGWLCLLSLIPYVGPAVSIIIGFIPGNAGQNQFGPDPIS